jgi:hypothetical protein
MLPKAIYVNASVSRLYRYLYLSSVLLACYTFRNTLFDLTWLPLQYRLRNGSYVTQATSQSMSFSSTDVRVWREKKLSIIHGFSFLILRGCAMAWGVSDRPLTQRPGINLRPVHMGFMVNRVVQVHFFSTS